MIRKNFKTIKPSDMDVILANKRINKRVLFANGLWDDAEPVDLTTTLSTMISNAKFVVIVLNSKEYIVLKKKDFSFGILQTIANRYMSKAIMVLKIMNDASIKKIDLSRMSKDWVNWNQNWEEDCSDRDFISLMKVVSDYHCKMLTSANF